MNTKPALTDSIAEGFDFACLFLMALPLAFPVIAFADGAQDHYLQLSLLFLVFALAVCSVGVMVCTAISSFFASFETDRLERIAATKALHSYLLNGGRA